MTRIKEKMVNKESSALVVFTKTPGYLAPKTRLAKDIGSVTARRVHQFLFDYTAKIIEQLDSSITVYWNCAEIEALNDPIWNGKQVIWDEGSSLKDKVCSITNRLLNEHTSVISIGTDCPFLKPSHIKEAQMSLSHYKRVLGPTRDGGFYLFGSQSLLPAKKWAETQWGQSRTAEEVLSLFPKQEVKLLAKLIDIDRLEDLNDFLALEKDLNSHSTTNNLSAI